MRIIVALSVAAACLSTPALAAGTPAKDKTVCKRMQSHDTGSNLRKRPARICKKASQWAAEESETQQGLRRVQERADGLVAPPNPGMGANPQ